MCELNVCFIIFYCKYFFIIIETMRIIISYSIFSKKRLFKTTSIKTIINTWTEFIFEQTFSYSLNTFKLNIDTSPKHETFTLTDDIFTFFNKYKNYKINYVSLCECNLKFVDLSSIDKEREIECITLINSNIDLIKTNTALVTFNIINSNIRKIIPQPEIIKLL